jgi:predicted transposase/invertase (TIGR01784 family)
LGFNIFDEGEPAVQTFSLVNTETNRCLRNTRGQELLKIAYFGLCNANIVEGSNLIYWRRFFLNQELGEGAPSYIIKAKELADTANLTREENEMISWREEASSILYGEMTFAVRKAKNEGMQAGIQTGIQANKLENAKNLIGMGLSNADIARWTGLLERDVKDLR